LQQRRLLQEQRKESKDTDSERCKHLRRILVTENKATAMGANTAQQQTIVLDNNCAADKGKNSSYDVPQAIKRLQIEQPFVIAIAIATTPAGQRKESKDTDGERCKHLRRILVTENKATAMGANTAPATNDRPRQEMCCGYRQKQLIGRLLSLLQ